MKKSTENMEEQLLFIQRHLKYTVMSSFCLGSNPQSGEAVLQCLGGEHPNACL